MSVLTPTPRGARLFTKPFWENSSIRGTPFTAGVVQIIDPDNRLVPRAVAGYHLKEHQSVLEPLSSTAGPEGTALATGHHAVRLEDDKSQDDVASAPWIRLNGLRTVICMPLIARDHGIGTLSIYVAYPFQFYESDVQFLQSIAFVLASLVERLRLVQDADGPRRESEAQMENLLSYAPEVGYNLYKRDLPHV